MALKDNLENGTWVYYSGVAGTVTLNSSELIVGIAAHATAAASFTINGGNTITVPANSSISISPQAVLKGATIIFTGTDSYFVEVLR